MITYIYQNCFCATLSQLIDDIAIGNEVGNQDICHESTYCEVRVAEKRNGLRQFIDQLTRYEDAFSCSYGIGSEIFDAIGSNIFLYGLAGFDLLGDLYTTGVQVAESWIVHVLVFWGNLAVV